jgi:hypothetical protein
MFAGLARTESCDQDCATSFYAIAAIGDQFAVCAANQMLPHSESEISPAKAQSRKV